MHGKKIIQIILIFSLTGSLINYFLNIYPLKHFGRNMSLGVVLISYLGFLSSYFSFFIWPNMPMLIYAATAIALIVFFNLFFASIFSTYGPLGIIVILIFLFLTLVIKNKKHKNM